MIRSKPSILPLSYAVSAASQAWEMSGVDLSMSGWSVTVPPSEILPVVTPLAPGNLPKYTSKVRFSFTRKTTCFTGSWATCAPPPVPAPVSGIASGDASKLPPSLASVAAASGPAPPASGPAPPTPPPEADLAAVSGDPHAVKGSVAPRTAETPAPTATRMILFRSMTSPSSERGRRAGLPHGMSVITDDRDRLRSASVLGRSPWRKAGPTRGACPVTGRLRGRGAGEGGHRGCSKHSKRGCRSGTTTNPS